VVMKCVSIPWSSAGGVEVQPQGPKGVRNCDAYTGDADSAAASAEPFHYADAL